MCGGTISQVSNSVNSALTQVSGVSNPLQDINSLASAATNLLNPFNSIVSIGSNGKPGLGYASHWVDETIGELTGRNAARDVTASNQVAVSNAAAQQNSLLAAQRKQRESNDIAASNTAGAIRKGAASQSRNTLGFSTITPSSGGSGDFLGL